LILLSEKRSALLISRCTTPVDLPASRSRNSNNNRSDEKQSHDDKGKDPLEGNHLVKELRNSNSGSKDAKREAHCVILVNHDEEESVCEDGPDEDVSKDTGHKVVRVGNHQSTVPVDGNKSPGQRSRNNGRVDKSGVGVVTEVERGKIDEVENQDNLGPVEVRADKEHDKGEVEEVVEDEMASDAGGSVNDVRVTREEMSDVASLEDEEDNPVYGGDDWVQSESGAIHVVLLPDLSVSSVAIIRTVKCVVDGDDKRQDPGDKSQDLVGEDRVVRVGVPFPKGIVLLPVRHDEVLMTRSQILVAGCRCLMYSVTSKS
jgi:hypothetical protein